MWKALIASDTPYTKRAQLIINTNRSEKSVGFMIVAKPIRSVIQGIIQKKAPILAIFLAFDKLII